MADERRSRHAASQRQANAPALLDPDLETAARAFVPDAARIQPIGNARQAQVDGPAGTWIVRRWRSGTTEGRIRFVHDLLRRLRAAGFEVVPGVLTLPDGSEALAREGILYDAQEWLPGAPIARVVSARGPGDELVNLPASLPTASQVELIETVASIHAESEALARVRGVPAFTLASAGAAVRDAWERARERLRPAAPATPAIQRWILAGERSLRPAIRDLASAPEIYRGTTVVGHGDLWPAHVLWTRTGPDSGGQRRLSGIVDWADAAAGSPLLDLAQLVTHFGGWTADAAEDAIGTYAAVRRLGPEERRLLPAAAVIDLIAEAGWLLSVAYGDGQRSRPLPTALRDGIDTLVTSLEHASAVAARGDRPIKPAARRWVHRPPVQPVKRREPRGAAQPRPKRGRDARTERPRDGGADGGGASPPSSSSGAN